MKRLFLLLVLIAAGVVAVGFYQGWFALVTGTVDGKPSLGVTVDKDKIKSDEQLAKEKVHDLRHPVKDKPAETVDKAR